jgi:hypothetical protein
MGGERRPTQYRNANHGILIKADRPQRIKASHYRLEPSIGNASATRGHPNLVEFDPDVPTNSPA